MPVRYEMKPQVAFGGCDVCGKSAKYGGFVLEYTFGYGSLIDGDSVETALCDDCLEKLIRENIPKASWTKA